jgi:transcriptional regulator with XRE-family HTH domain
MTRRTNLAAFMAELGLKQYEVAAVVGLDPITISRYRRGMRDIPPRHVEQICAAFDVGPEKILGWHEDEDWDDPFDRRLRGLNPHAGRDY